MKYLIFLLPLFIFGQDIKVYSHDRFGNLQPVPTQTVKRTAEGLTIYNHNRFGVREDQPTTVIKRTGEVYKFNRFGVRNDRPTMTIQRNENKTQTRVHTTRTRTVRREFGRR